MHVNEWSRFVGVLPLYPQGTNSTMFTECCEVAICDTQGLCPKCKREVIGADDESEYDRGRTRWRYATRHWDRG